MELDEIFVAGFFRAIIIDYVDYYVHNYYQDHDRLIYTLCNSDEEKDVATLAEIAKIKKKIIKIGYEHLSMDFMNRYIEGTYPVDHTKEVNHPNYWENYFHEFFIREIDIQEIGDSFTPFTDAQSIIENLPKNYCSEDLDYDTLKAIVWMADQTQDVPSAIEVEKEIMSWIKIDFERYKEEGEDEWDIDWDLYKGFTEQSQILKLFFKLCKLLVLLYRLKMFKSFLGLKTEEYIRNPLKDKLEKYGFFNLPMVKQIPIDKHSSLIDLLTSSKIPYTIAFLDYIGFLKHLEKEHFQTKYKLNLEIAKLLNSNARAIKGNISSLLPNSTEDKNRYTAYRHKEMVEKEYLRLK